MTFSDPPDELPPLPVSTPDAASGDGVLVEQGTSHQLWEDMLSGPHYTDSMQEPGLFPAFHFFVSNWMMEYVSCAPGRINALSSAFAMVRPEKQYAAYTGDYRVATEHVRNARAVFLDSGAITPLLRNARGTGKPEEVRSWVERTDLVVQIAHEFAAAGAPTGVVAAMDLPAYADLLAPAGWTVPEAERITLRNAEQMLAAELPEGWRPVFTSQGVTLEEHVRCMAQYERMGILDHVRAGNAWLAIGGMAFEDNAERVHVVHRKVRELVGPQGHIHALGVSRLPVLVPMIRRGWVQSADSSSPAQEIRYNRGPYQVQGPRLRFLVSALHASSAIYAEVQLAQALERAQRIPDMEQTGWLDSVA